MIFDIFFKRYLLELTGASVRFAFSFLKSKIFGGDYIKFEEYWNAKKGNYYNKLETETANRIAGIIFFAIALSILIFFYV